jgi:hypothetical protein
MKLPDLPELELTDTGLVYAGRQVDFRSIDGITFKVLPLLQNRLARAFWGFDTSYPLGLSSSTPRLGLHFANGEIMWLSNGWDFTIQSARLEAISAAAEFLSERTFSRRLERFRQQFRLEDRFSYGRYHFFRNGDILKSSKRIYNVHDSYFSVVLGPFHIHFEQKEAPFAKLWSLVGQLGHTIEISRDRDCFLSMYRLAYGTCWADERYLDGVRCPELGV